MNTIRQKKVESNANKGNYCPIQVRKPHRQFGHQDRMDKRRIKITDTASRLNRQQMGQYCNTTPRKVSFSLDSGQTIALKTIFIRS